METTKLVGIIHAYPSKYILDSLACMDVKVVLFCPQNPDFSHPNLAEIVDCELEDWDTVTNIVSQYHDTNPLCALLPIYEGAVEITAIIAEKLGLFSISPLVAAASRNKYLTFQAWSENHLPTPKTIDISAKDNRLQFVEQELGFPVILKLADSMNSQGVILVKNSEEFTNAINKLDQLIKRPVNFNSHVDRNRNAYARSEIKILAQEFCEGAEVSVDIVCNNGEYQVLGIFEKAISTGPYFAETMSIHPTSLGKEQDKQIGELAIQALQAMQFHAGVAHIEIRNSKTGPKLLEVGLRPGGAYTVMAIEHLLGINLYVALLKIYLGLLPTEIKPNPKAMLYGGVVYQESGILKSVAGTEVFATIPNLLDVQILNKVGDPVVAMPNSAQPHFCYYLLAAETAEQARATHEHIRNSIQLEVTKMEVENG